MIPRTCEPIADDPLVEAEIYRDMDHTIVNRQFVDDLILGGPVGPWVVDLGCGPAHIPILLCEAIQGDGGETHYRPAQERLRVMATDVAVEMLEIAKFEIEMAGRVEQIELQQIDLNQPNALQADIADTLMCNTVLHHLDDPTNAIGLAIRAAKPGGRLFVRDLFRPASSAEVEALVEQHGGESSSAQLLRQSLHAAFTLDEIRTIIAPLGIEAEAVQITSDRHWTIDWTKP
ncbi:class I SAM-dependent methyltransferase [Neorhodopirellula pilleata]|uniref:Ubiquinone biosynthesis O-methyltransferase n=1 Tax=Neorhodopirellula pilleata TaxID=2714738 RepID=A0A5C5ZY08_9BACT|nr:methyltransferase domain-containing protein [Neorhodopirellula pilleata]TWT92542.1 Ubiquinone biosynthesis O-methyltransferase [Neorhodopirellula pilleata]